MFDVFSNAIKWLLLWHWSDISVFRPTRQHTNENRKFSLRSYVWCAVKFSNHHYVLLPRRARGENRIRKKGHRKCRKIVEKWFGRRLNVANTSTGQKKPQTRSTCCQQARERAANFIQDFINSTCRQSVIMAVSEWVPYFPFVPLSPNESQTNWLLVKNRTSFVVCIFLVYPIRPMPGHSHGKWRKILCTKLTLTTACERNVLEKLRNDERVGAGELCGPPPAADGQIRYEHIQQKRVERRQHRAQSTPAINRLATVEHNLQ